MWVFGLSKIGQFLQSDREGNLGASVIDRLRGRHFLAALLYCAAITCIGLTDLRADERRIELYNIHTKNDISVVYKRNGQFVPDALKQLNHFMRDWRRDATTEIDPKLFDLIWDIHRELGSKKPVHLISGYRSPKTNAMLRKSRGGQATKSKHMTGQAADIHFPDISVKQLRNSALIREKGGVGYYPTSAIPFVHVDTGNVRHWPRLPRQELAILFPTGQSKHVPADGKPITKSDFEVALANLQSRGGELPIALQKRLNGGGGTPMLASLPPAGPLASSAPVPTPQAAPKNKLVLASLTPFDGLVRPERKSESVKPLVEAKPVLSASLRETGGKPGRADQNRVFRRDSPERGPSDTVPQDQIVSAPEYDDDHPDELNYQPFPILPFMSDTPIASMDLSGNADLLSLGKVHMFFGESQQMLVSQFKPGLQYAQLYWAQQFRGTAVNTEIKRIVRRNEPAPVRTAQQAQPVRR